MDTIVVIMLFVTLACILNLICFSNKLNTDIFKMFQALYDYLILLSSSHFHVHVFCLQQVRECLLGLGVKNVSWQKCTGDKVWQV